MAKKITRSNAGIDYRPASNVLETRLNCKLDDCSGVLFIAIADGRKDYR